MSTPNTLVWTTIDYDKAGKQVGVLNLEHSVTRSGYGMIRIPIGVIKNGSGPTILLMAGNHGDEYEGQIALSRFLRVVDPGAVEGRIIILPALNLPAALAGTRVSPLDDANLNRVFPGDARGGPTRAIAHYVSTVLFPMCTAMHDFHAGGSSMHYKLFASAFLCGADIDQRAIGALKAFAPPLAKIWAGAFDRGNSHAAAASQGVVALGGEFGGAGGVSIEGIELIETGMHRFLSYFEVIDLPTATPPPPETRWVEVRDQSYFVYASDRGVYEPLVRLGDQVDAGQPAAQIHFIENPTRAPVTCHFESSGMVVCRRAIGRCEPGDCLFHIATDVPTPD